MTTKLDHLDGPALVRWLRENGLFNLELQLGNRARDIRHWEAGQQPSVYAADEILVKLGLHLSEIPDDLWVGRQKAPTGPKLSERERREIALRVADGEPEKRVAQEVGVSPSAVRYLVKGYPLR